MTENTEATLQVCYICTRVYTAVYCSVLLSPETEPVTQDYRDTDTEMTSAYLIEVLIPNIAARSLRGLYLY